MKRIPWRPLISVIVLLATVSAFVWYFVTHESVRQELAAVPPATLGIILLLYIGTIFALTLVLLATLRLCRLTIKPQESALLTAYTAVVNFFGPLQSGPAFRGVYLKARYKLSLKKYAGATLVYYFFYGAISGLFLVSGILGWWLLPLAVVGLLAALLLRHSPYVKPKVTSLDLGGWYYLAGATLLQLSLVAVIYYVELHAVDSAITFSQAIIYAGAASLALFVSLTPGAIGFRESFLLFSQDLHQVDANTIVTVSIIDRAMYIVLLLILGVFIIASHARKRLDKAIDSND